MEYESNPKHSDPWQVGAKGSLCPKELKSLAAELLEKSELVGKQRFAFHDGRAYCAREHRAGVCHGYPVGWVEVPGQIRNKWKRDGSVTKRDLDRFWESDS